MNPEERQRRDEFITRLMGQCEVRKVLETKTDDEIADLVMEVLWSDTDMSSPVSQLIDTVIDRLRRTNKGRIDPERDCAGKDRCHGCMKWCDACGDVSKTCDDRYCDVHEKEDQAV